MTGSETVASGPTPAQAQSCRPAVAEIPQLLPIPSHSSSFCTNFLSHLFEPDKPPILAVEWTTLQVPASEVETTQITTLASLARRPDLTPLHTHESAPTHHDLIPHRNEPRRQLNRLLTRCPLLVVGINDGGGLRHLRNREFLTVTIQTTQDLFSDFHTTNIAFSEINNN
ncbi:MAG: hypothetical protein IJK99_09335 [Bacteroidales bacterium]|nr:hypothetical protein [Bacteroidales bacterium]